MTLRTTATLAVLATSLAAPGQAFDLGNGFMVFGEVELSHTTDDFSSASLLSTDVTLSWRNGATSGLGFGVDLTVDSLYDVSVGDDFTRYWGGLVLTTGVGDVTIGAARPVLDSVYSFPDFGTANFTQVLLVPSTQSYTGFFSILAQESVVTGISLVGSAGNLTYGASIHELDVFTTTIRSSQIVLSYAAGNTTFLGGFEVVTVDDGVTDSNADVYRIGVVHDVGAFSLGAEYSGLNISTSPTAAQTLARLHVGYAVNDALKVMADVGLSEVGPLEESIWAISAEFGFANGGFIQGGVTDLGSDSAWDVGLGFRF